MDRDPDPRKSGYVRTYRSLIGHPAFRDDAEAMAFNYLILRASWRDCVVRYRRRVIPLKRGELVMTVRDLADSLDRDKGWIERLLNRLKTETMIETTVVKKLLVIRICNYDKYQADPGTGETPDETIRRTRLGRQRDAEQEREKPKQNSLSEDRGQRARKNFDEAVDALRDMGARRHRAQEAVKYWQKRYPDEVILRAIDYARSTKGSSNVITWTSYWLEDFMGLETVRKQLS